MSGISYAGTPTERMFRELTGATTPRNRSDGDAYLFGHYVEVKLCTSESVKQVRPCRYCTLAVSDGVAWYVVPANDVVRFAMNTSRGQHTENPFECFCPEMSRVRPYRADDLTRACRDAMGRSDRYIELRRIMRRVAIRAHDLTEEIRSEVRRTMLKGPDGGEPMLPPNQSGLFA